MFLFSWLREQFRRAAREGIALGVQDALADEQIEDTLARIAAPARPELPAPESNGATKKGKVRA